MVTNHSFSLTSGYKDDDEGIRKFLFQLVLENAHDKSVIYISPSSEVIL